MSNLLTLTDNQKIELFDNMLLQRNAEITLAQSVQNVEPYGFQIDLATARTPALKNGIPLPPFIFLRTFAGTDGAELQIVYNADNWDKQADILYNNSEIDAGIMFSGGTFYNTAQAGKVISFRAYRYFKVKSSAVIISGNVAVARPSVGVDTLVTSLTANGVLLAVNTSAKKRTITNNTGGWMYIKFASSGTVTGIYLLPGETWETENTAALYQLCQFAVANGISITEET